MTEKLLQSLRWIIGVDPNEDMADLRAPIADGLFEPFGDGASGTNRKRCIHSQVQTHDVRGPAAAHQTFADIQNFLVAFRDVTRVIFNFR